MSLFRCLRPSRVFEQVGQVVTLVTFVFGVGACGDDGDEGQDASGAGVTYCDVAPIVQERCLRCHGEPLSNHAPLQLVTFEDFHVGYPREDGEPAFLRAKRQVSASSMPPVTMFPELEPPVAPLAPAEKSLLLDWLNDGAPRGAGCSIP